MMKPADNRTYYDILQVEPDASQSAIRQSYRRLMQTEAHHPDLGGDPHTAALINKAYATLSDARQRADYDRELAVVSYTLNAKLAESGRVVVPERRRPPDPARVCFFCEAAHNLGRRAEPENLCERCGSPLRLADNNRLETAGKRAVARVRKRMELTFFTDWRQGNGFAGWTEDISPSGLRLVSRRLIEADQRVRIASGFVEAAGIVTHCSPRRRGWKTEHVAGVSFVTSRFLKSVGGFVSRRV